MPNVHQRSIEGMSKSLPLGIPLAEFAAKLGWRDITKLESALGLLGYLDAVAYELDHPHRVFLVCYHCQQRVRERCQPMITILDNTLQQWLLQLCQQCSLSCHTFLSQIASESP